VQTYFTPWVIELKSCIYPYCRIYQKQYTCPTLVLGQVKKKAKNSYRNRNFRQIKWRIVIKTMCILWGGIN
jgi:hypothetical protein